MSKAYGELVPPRKNLRPGFFEMVTAWFVRMLMEQAGPPPRRNPARRQTGSL